MSSQQTNLRQQALAWLAEYREALRSFEEDSKLLAPASTVWVMEVLPDGRQVCLPEEHKPPLGPETLSDPLRSEVFRLMSAPQS